METFETVSETKLVVQVTCRLEGKEELQDLVLGTEEQVEVRIG